MLLDATAFCWPFALTLSTLWKLATSEANFPAHSQAVAVSIAIALMRRILITGYPAQARPCSRRRLHPCSTLSYSMPTPCVRTSRVI